MRIHYRTSYARNQAFHRAYVREFEEKAIPAWFRKVSGMFFVIGIAIIGYALFPSPGRLIALFAGILLFGWLFYLGYGYCERLFMTAYLRESGDIEAYTAEVSDGRYMVESRGVRTSLPLSAVSMAYERDGFIFIYFGRLGAARVPIEAFESPAQRSAFMGLVNAEKQIAQPARPSATP